MNIGMIAGAYCADPSVFENCLRELREIGFTAIDYQGFVNTDTPLFSMSDDAFDAYVLEHKAIADRVGMRVYQAHGPWRWPPVDDTAEGREERFEKMMRAVRGTAALGCDRMILHNLMPSRRIDTDPTYVKELNAAFFTRLCAYARDFGVTVCLENMPFACQCLARPDRTAAFVRSLNLENLRVCLDTGHAQVVGMSPATAVRLIGKNDLFALHVHDTDGLRDRHWLIGDGVIDWAAFGAALREIGFEGCLSIESTFPPNTAPTERRAGLERLYAAAQAILYS